MLSIASSILLLIIITIALIVIDPVVASVAAFGFGLSYALITWIARRRLSRNSRRIADEQPKSSKLCKKAWVVFVMSY